LQMDLIMMENLKQMRLVVEESISGLMENSMMGIGRKIKCMGLDYLYGKMARNMKENLLMIREKGKEHLHGLMAVSILENGKVENNMDKVHT